MPFSPHASPLMPSPTAADRTPPVAAWSRRGALGLIASAGLMLTGCQPLPPPPLRLGMNAWVGYDTLVLARELELTDPKQLRVIELASGSATLRNLRNGLLDAAAVTLDEALILRAEGVDLRIVAVLDESRGADLVMAEAGLTRPADLRGESIAVESTTVGTLMLQRLLEAGGLSLPDVTVINIEAPQHLGALRSGRVRAAVTYEPVAAELREAGYRRIFDSAQIPGDIQDVLVVSAEVLRERPQQVDALLKAWSQGLKNLQADPLGSARILSGGLDLEPKAYVSILGQLRFLSPQESVQRLRGPQPELGVIARPLVEALRRMERLPRPPDWPSLVDPQPGQRLLDRMGAS